MVFQEKTLKRLLKTQNRMISPGEHITIFGITGSGKSTLSKNIAEYFSRIIYFDRLREHNYEDAIFVYDYKGFADAYRSCENLSSFKIVIRFRPGLSEEDLERYFESILRLVHTRETNLKLGLLLYIEEVWLYSSPHYLNPWFKEILLTGRHDLISVLSNSQRPASTHRDIPSQSRHIFIGQYHDGRDAQYFREILPNDYKITIALKKYTFVWFRADAEKPITITSRA